MEIDEIVRICMLFGSSFSLIGLLGFQSQLVRFKEVIPSFVTSLIIGTLQLVIYRSTPNATITESVAYVLGGSFGLIFSIYAHSIWMRIKGISEDLPT